MSFLLLPSKASKIRCSPCY
ncbi:hypothetical protein DRF62_11285 [Chryseobacterium piscium]|uniref:Uncharacterized protein n=1 Tax=Chryseobacterium piscium TaxID=333702 RepID=A0A3D9BKF8_9FLAO|nr:hypothetical protein DRF62_11285 [Chryseobacterium piscium]